MNKLFFILWIALLHGGISTALWHWCLGLEVKSYIALYIIMLTGQLAINVSCNVYDKKQREKVSGN